MRLAVHVASATTVACCILLGVVQFYSSRQIKQSHLLQLSAKHGGHAKAALNTVSPAKNDKVTIKSLKSLNKPVGSKLEAKEKSANVKTKILKTRKASGGKKAHKPVSVFENIKRAMLKELSLSKKSKKHPLQQKAEVAAADAAEEGMEGEEEDDAHPETNFDPVKSTVYVYAGREVKPHSTEVAAYILESGFGVGKVGYINSASDSDVRSALWDEDCKAVIFPPLKDIPDFGPAAAKDFKAFVSQGFHNGGTVILLGSPVEVHLLNELFGFELQQDYQEGPYYKDGRYTRTSVWDPLPGRLREQGQTESLGLLQSTLPPESRSYYDSFGDSVAACTRYDLGRVCYLAQDFSVLADLPELLAESEGGDEEGGGGAENNALEAVEEMERTTDSWLAVFRAMLEQSESDIAPEGLDDEAAPDDSDE